MSVDYYQRIVNGLDKEIADLEKKQASADKKRLMKRRRQRALLLVKMLLHQR